MSHIRDMLDPVLERLGPKGVLTEAKVRKLWPQLVGPQLAGNGYVIRLRGTTLVVGATSDAWATELRYLSSVLMDKVNERVGKGTVTEVVVRTKRLG